MWLTLRQLEALARRIPSAEPYLRADKITCGYAHGAYLDNITSRMHAAGEHRLAERLVFAIEKTKDRKD
jgi:hypothetical protein